MASTPFLSKCVTKIDTNFGRCSRFAFAVANCQGWRSTQEDAHLCIVDYEPNTSLFAVFDGHNGSEVAKFVSKHLPKQLLKNAAYRHGFIERGLQESFMALDELLLTREANDLLLHYREKSGLGGRSLTNSEYPLSFFTGCTAVVLLIKNDIYYCANIGDSRCLVCRDGRAKQLSKDHKPDSSEERSRIERAGGSVINGRINMGIDVSRAFGDHWFKRNSKLNQKQQMIIAWPHTTVEKLSNNDEFIVLICDGIWNSMNNQELVDFISKRFLQNLSTHEIDLQQMLVKICEQVIKHILPVSPMPKMGIAGKDNMTIMIIKRTTTSSISLTATSSVNDQQSTNTINRQETISQTTSKKSNQQLPINNELSSKLLKSTMGNSGKKPTNLNNSPTTKKSPKINQQQTTVTPTMTATEVTGRKYKKN